MKKAQTLLKILPTIEALDYVKGEFVNVNVKPSAFIDDENVLHISGEDGLGLVDYYGEGRGGYAYIHPDLEAWAAKNGGYWEWDNAASISIYAV
jgi:hypothetical protein